MLEHILNVETMKEKISKEQLFQSEYNPPKIYS